MTLLTLGVLLWAVTHLMLSVTPSVKQSIAAKTGDNGFKGIFSLTMLVALALIISGWRSIEQPDYLYTLPLWTRHLGILLVLLGFILFVASGQPTRIKQYLRHPQLTGLILWAAAHLLMNGDSRSLVLFLGLAAWALGEMVAINRREGAWVKSDPPGWTAEVDNVAVAAVVYIAVAFAHPWLSGVAIM